MRVLVVRLGAFGDILHTLPLAAELQAAGHQVGWLAEDRWASLLAGSAAIAALHLLPRGAVRAGSPASRLAALAGVIRGLRAGDYAVAIDAQGLAKSAFLTAASSAPCRVGHAPPTARELSWLLIRRQIATRATHVIDQQRDLAAGVGLRPSGPWRFPLPPWDHERAWGRAAAAVAGHAPWMFNVGAGWPTKVWPMERQVELVRRLRARAVPLLLLWGAPAERAAAEELRARAGYGTLAPPTTIPRLAGLMAQAAMVISGDTGPLHLAFALGVRCVGLFGPVPAVRNGPRGPGCRSLQAPAAPWERHDLSKVDMGAISVEAVLAAADAALTERPSART
jgi:heptosyltransferase-1